MKTFDLSCSVTVSAFTFVEAETLEKAIRIAERRTVEIGGERHGNDPSDTWIIDDADGSPQEIHES